MASAGLGPDLVILLFRGLLAGAPEVAPAGLGPELVIFLLRGLFAGAPEVAPAGLGPELVIFLLRGLLAGASEVALARIGHYRSLLARIPSSRIGVPSPLPLLTSPISIGN